MRACRRRTKAVMPIAIPITTVVREIVDAAPADTTMIACDPRAFRNCVFAVVYRNIARGTSIMNAAPRAIGCWADAWTRSRPPRSSRISRGFFTNPGNQSAKWSKTLKFVRPSYRAAIATTTPPRTITATVRSISREVVERRREDQKDDDQAEKQRQRLQRLPAVAERVDCPGVDDLRRERRDGHHEQRLAHTKRLDLALGRERPDRETDHEKDDHDAIELELEREIHRQPVELDRDEPEHPDEQGERVRPGDQRVRGLAETDERGDEEGDATRCGRVSTCRGTRAERDQARADDRDDRDRVGPYRLRAVQGALRQLVPACCACCRPRARRGASWSMTTASMQNAAMTAIAMSVGIP